MKKLIILIILIVSFSVNVISQLPYRPLSDYNGNKAAYLKYNFDERGSVYVGNTFENLLNNVELAPLGYIRFMAESKNDNQTYILGITVFFSNYYSNNFSPLNDNYLTIWWETPFLLDEIKEVEKQYPANNWVVQHYNYFKDKRIKLIKFKVM
jgi:hypothetical protein